MNSAHQQAIISGGAAPLRKISIASQISQSSQSLHQMPGNNNSFYQFNNGAGNVDIRQFDSSRIASRQASNNLNDCVVTDNDSCVGFAQNKQLIANLRHSVFLMDESILAPSSSANAVSSPPNKSNIEMKLQSSNCVVANNYRDKRIIVTSTTKRRFEGEYDIPSESMSVLLLEGDQSQSWKQLVELINYNLSTIPNQLLLKKNQILDLDLSKNLFDKFPIELCDFIHLKRLNMDYNQITQLPEQIAFLKHLEMLSVSHNYLRELPGTLQSISRMKILDISHNFIEKISSEITNLHKLESLSINNNLFTHLPYKFSNLRKLKDLSLDWLKYVKPSLESTINRANHNYVFNKLFELCNRKSSSYMNQDISLKEFSQYLSQYDHELTHPDIRGRTIAFSAAENEELGVLKALFDEKVNINALDSDNYTLLINSLLQNKKKSIKFLLDCGADPKIGGGQLGSTLHLAVSRLDINITNKLLDLGVNPNGRDLDGNTPLHVIFCSFSKNVEDAKQICIDLLSKGADPNALSNELWSSLHMAVRRNQKEALKFASEYNNRENSKFQLEQEGENDNFDFNDDQGSDDFNGYQAASQYEKNQNIIACRITTEPEPSRTTRYTQFLSDKVEKKEDNFSENNEYRSPRISNQQSHIYFNHKTSKQHSKKLFNFDIEGGANLWTPMHLAANIGNVELLEILSQANANPFSLTLQSQTPRKVALQSLILFKILRKYESKWSANNILRGEEEGHHHILNKSNLNMLERSIQNMRAFIAETMKSKEHFLHSQLDFFDDKEFGYSIKTNMLNNQILLPRNSAQGVSQEEEEEIFDPDMSLEKSNAIKFGVSGETLSIHNSSLIGSGTLKPQQFGYGLPKTAKADGRIFVQNLSKRAVTIEKRENCDDDEDDNDSLIEEDLFEKTSERSLCAHHINKSPTTKLSAQNLNEGNQELLFPSSSYGSQAFRNDFQVINNNFSNFLDIPSNQPNATGVRLGQQIEEEENQKSINCFTDLKQIEIGEIDRLCEIVASRESVFQESLSSLMLLRFLYIRLSEKNMMFSSDKGTLPRNIHILNEFLLSKLSKKEASMWRESILTLISSKIFEQLFATIQPLPIPQEASMNYFELSKASQVHQSNIKLSQLLLFAKDTLLNLNFIEFFQSFNKQCFSKFTDEILAFSTADFSSSVLLFYENYHTFNQLQQIPHKFEPLKYQIIGSPSFYSSHSFQQYNKISLKQRQRTGSINHHQAPIRLDSQAIQAPTLPIQIMENQFHSALNQINTNQPQFQRNSSVPHSNKLTQSILKNSSHASTNKYFKDENLIKMERRQFRPQQTGEENIEDDEEMCQIHLTLEANLSCVERKSLKHLSWYAHKM